MSDTVEACPEFDDTTIRAKATGRTNAGSRHDERWRCWGCGATFDEPATREPRGATMPRSGPARALHDADPEDLDDLAAGEGD